MTEDKALSFGPGGEVPGPRALGVPLVMLPGRRGDAPRERSRDGVRGLGKAPGRLAWLAALLVLLVLPVLIQAHTEVAGDSDLAACPAAPTAFSCAHVSSSDLTDQLVLEDLVIPAGEDRLLVVVINHLDQTGAVTNTRVQNVVIVGGGALQVAVDGVNSVITTPDGEEHRIFVGGEIWYRAFGDSAASSQVDLRVTWGAEVVAAVVTALVFEGVDQSDPIGAAVGTGGISQNAAALVDTERPNTQVVGGAIVTRFTGGGLEAHPDVIELHETETGASLDDALVAVGRIETADDGLSHDFGWGITLAGALTVQDWALVAAEINTHPDVAFVAESSQGYESVTSVSLGLTATSGFHDPVRVDYQVVASGTTAPPEDYLLPVPAGTATLPGSIPLPVVDNDELDGPRTVRVRIFNPQNAHLSGTDPVEHTYTILDDDRRVAFVAPSSSFAEGTGEAPVGLRLGPSAWPESDLAVSYHVVGGTATPGEDYLLSPEGTVVVPAGSGGADLRPVLLSDVLDEDDETVLIELQEPTAKNLRLLPAGPQVHTLILQDDDPMPTLGFVTPSSSDPEDTDSGSLHPIAVALSAPSGRDVQVGYEIAPESTAASAGAFPDHTLAAGTLQIPRGQTTAAIPYGHVPDDRYELDETLVIRLTGFQYAQPTDGATVHTHTLLNDDDVPDVGFAGASSAENEETPGPRALRVTLSAAAGVEFPVAYRASGGGATPDQDYALAPGELVFAEGETEKEVPLPILNDEVDEESETVEVSLSVPAGASTRLRPGFSAHTHTILDPETAELSLAGGSVPEGDDGEIPFLLTASLSRPSSREVAATVELAPAAGSRAVAGTDYGPGAGTVTIPAGSTSAPYGISVRGDVLDELDEVLEVRLGTPTGGAGRAAGPALVTLVDDDAVAVRAEPVTVGEGNETADAVVARILVVPSGTADHDITFRVDTRGGPVLGPGASADFTAIEDGRFTLRAGTPDGTASEVVVEVLEDTTDEAQAESFEVVLGSRSPADPGFAGLAVPVSIRDDDVVEVFVADAEAVEGGPGPAGALGFPVTLSVPLDEALALSFVTADGTARAGQDFDCGPCVLLIPAGATSGTLTVSAVPDPRDETDEWFGLGVASVAPRGRVGDGDARGSIVDDDVASFAVEGAEADENAGSVLRFVIRAIAASDQEITLRFHTEDGVGPDGAVAGRDYEGIPEGTAVLPPGDDAVAIEVPVRPDGIEEGPESLDLVLTDAQGSAIVVARAGGTIRDDDLAWFGWEAPEETAEGASAAFRLLRHGEIERDVRVDLSPYQGDPPAGADHPADPGVDFLFDGGQWVEFREGGPDRLDVAVPIVQDRLDERDLEWFGLAAVRATRDSPAVPAYSYIRDDDAARLSVTASEPAREGEEGDEAWAVFTVSLDIASDRPVSVHAATVPSVDSSATPGVDFLPWDGVVTFPPDGPLSHEVRVRVLPDGRFEGDEVFGLALDGADGATVSGGPAWFSIADDDQLLFAVGDVTVVEGGPGEEGFLRFPVTLSVASDRPVSVDYITEAVGADGLDFRSVSGTVWFAPGETLSFLFVPTLGDDLVEGDEQVRLVLREPPVGALDPAASTGVGAIQDDDLAAILLATGRAAAEGPPGTGVPGSVILSLGGRPMAPITVRVTPLEGLADGSFEVTILPDEWDWPHVLSLAAADDGIPEGLHGGAFQVEVLAGDAAFVALPPQVLWLPIADDDSPGIRVLGPDILDLVEGESGEYALVLTSQPTGAVCVSPRSDSYEVLVGGGEAICFGPGDWNVPHAVRVTARADGLDEADSTAARIRHILQTEDPDYRGILVPDAPRVRALDDDAPPVVGLRAAVGQLDEGDAGAWVEVFLGQPSGRSVSVALFFDGAAGARPGSDYRVLDAVGLPVEEGRLFAFPAGTTSRWFRVVPVTDGEVEPTERAGLRIASPRNASLGESEIQLAIRSLDAFGVRFADLPLTLPDGQPALSGVALAARPAPGEEILVRVASLHPDRLRLAEPEAVFRFTALDWDILQAFVVEVLEGDAREGPWSGELEAVLEAPGSSSFRDAPAVRLHIRILDDEPSLFGDAPHPPTASLPPALPVATGPGASPAPPSQTGFLPDFDLTDRLELTVAQDIAHLSWDGPPEVRGYQVWRTQDGAWSVAATQSRDETAFTDSLAPGARYKLTYFTGDGLDRGHAADGNEAPRINGWDEGLYREYRPAPVDPMALDEPLTRSTEGRDVPAWAFWTGIFLGAGALLTAFLLAVAWGAVSARLPAPRRSPGKHR